MSWSEDSFADQNDKVRVDILREVDAQMGVALMSFFRKLDMPHLYHEKVAPSLEAGDSTIFAAVRDGPVLGSVSPAAK